MSQYHQTSPESTFAGKSTCSLTTQQGRITLTNGRLITTTGTEREGREVESEQEYQDLLKA